MVTKVAIRVKRQDSGLFALVDDDDAEKVLCHTWRLNRDGYPVTTLRIEGKNSFPETLHQFILGRVHGKCIDHINRNRLDCRRENLRHVTHLENLVNRGKQENSTSPYKGVTKRAATWTAGISVYGEVWRFGGFQTAEEAARFYDSLAYGIYGDVAGLNFPGEVK